MIQLRLIKSSLHQFEFAKMQKPDKFGGDYTVYCTIREEVEDEKSQKKTRKKTAKQNNDLPFLRNSVKSQIFLEMIKFLEIYHCS